MKFYQSGRSMVEMLGVLAIIGVLSVGAISGYSKAMMKYKLNKFVVALDKIYFNLSNFYYKDNTFSFASSRNLNANIIIFPEELTSNGILKNAISPWKNKMTIYFNPKELGGTPQIMVFGVNFDTCLQIMSYNWLTTDWFDYFILANDDSSFVWIKNYDFKNGPDICKSNFYPNKKMGIRFIAKNFE